MSVSEEEKEYANSVREAVTTLNALLREKPSTINVRVDLIDMSTLSGRVEAITTKITKDI